MKPPAQTVSVEHRDDTHRLVGTWAGVEAGNRFLAHLETRRFSPATVRANAFDLVCLGRFLMERSIEVADVVPTDVFEWVDWQSATQPAPEEVVAITAKRGAAASSVKRRAAAARAFFEYLVMAGDRDDKMQRQHGRSLLVPWRNSPSSPYWARSGRNATKNSQILLSRLGPRLPSREM